MRSFINPVPSLLLRQDKESKRGFSWELKGGEVDKIVHNGRITADRV